MGIMSEHTLLETPQYPMRVVVRRTGLKSSLLRAWERRYEAVVPGRSEGGQRLYSESDIRRLVLLRELVDAGHNISQVARLDAGELERLIRRERRFDEDPLAAVRRPLAAEPPGAEEPGEAGLVAAGNGTETVALLQAALVAVEQEEPLELERVLNRAAVRLTPGPLVDGVMVPLLRRVGRHWQEGGLGPATEHIASGVVRRFLERLVTDSVNGAGTPVLVVGTPAGQRHEFGGLLAAMIGAIEGWDVIWLGADLPASEIADVARRREARVVALSALHPEREAEVLEELLELRREIPDEVEMVVGGPGAAGFSKQLEEEGIRFQGDLSGFRVMLEEIKGGRG